MLKSFSRVLPCLRFKIWKSTWDLTCLQPLGTVQLVLTCFVSQSIIITFAQSSRAPCRQSLPKSWLNLACQRLLLGLFYVGKRNVAINDVEQRTIVFIGSDRFCLWFSASFLTLGLKHTNLFLQSCQFVHFHSNKFN